MLWTKIFFTVVQLGVTISESFTRSISSQSESNELTTSVNKLTKAHLGLSNNKGSEPLTLNQFVTKNPNYARENILEGARFARQKALKVPHNPKKHDIVTKFNGTELQNLFSLTNTSSTSNIPQNTTPISSPKPKTIEEELNSRPYKSWKMEKLRTASCGEACCFFTIRYKGKHFYKVFFLKDGTKECNALENDEFLFRLLVIKKSPHRYSDYYYRLKDGTRVNLPEPNDRTLPDLLILRLKQFISEGKIFKTLAYYIQNSMAEYKGVSELMPKNVTEVPPTEYQQEFENTWNIIPITEWLKVKLNKYCVYIMPLKYYIPNVILKMVGAEAIGNQCDQLYDSDPAFNELKIHFFALKFGPKVASYFEREKCLYAKLSDNTLVKIVCPNYKNPITITSIQREYFNKLMSQGKFKEAEDYVATYVIHPELNKELSEKLQPNITTLAPTTPCSKENIEKSIKQEVMTQLKEVFKKFGTLKAIFMELKKHEYLSFKQSNKVTKKVIIKIEKYTDFVWKQISTFFHEKIKENEGVKSTLLFQALNFINDTLINNPLSKEFNEAKVIGDNNPTEV